ARTFSGTSSRHAFAFGAALNARGVLGIIVAVIGQTLGFFGPEVYGMIVVTSLVTSLAAPLALKSLLKPEILSSDSKSEEPTDGYQRILLPVRMRDIIDIRLREVESALISRVAAPPPMVTLMTVLEKETPKQGSQFLEGLARTLPSDSETTKRVVTGDPAAKVIAEAANGYDLVLLGASEPRPDSDRLFGPFIDDVVRMAQCETMIISAGPGAWPPKRVLVPTAGSLAATRAAEFAFWMGDESTEIVIFHVVDPELALLPQTRENSLATPMDIGQSLMDDLRELGQRSGVQVTTEIVMGPRIVSAIVERARRDIDLIVVGTHVRPGSSRLYLGPKVERLLKEAPCTSLLLNSVLTHRYSETR
ncbi:MAG: universal stress protein, partial [Acidimicrobiia bacterium]